MDELGPLGLGPIDQLQGGAGRNSGDDEIDGPRYLLQPRVRFQPEELVQLGVYRIYGAGESDLDQALHELVSLTPLVR